MPIKHNRLATYLATRYYDTRIRDLKKLIFTATTGRSGTATLQKVFETIPHCKSVHEPYPIMNGSILEAASIGDRKFVRDFYRQRKAINIRRAAAGSAFYLEANHLFIKTFIDEVVRDFGERIAVIHLLRDPIDVAKSLYQLNDFATERAALWWLDYRATSNRIAIADILDRHPEFSHLFYKGLWYWFEVEARIVEWKQSLPHIRFIRFETEWFNDREKVYHLFEELGMEYRKNLLDPVIGVQENKRRGLKLGDDIVPDRSVEMLQMFEEMLVAEKVFPVGVAVPSLGRGGRRIAL